MDGKKIWYVLVLLVLVAMVQAAASCTGVNCGSTSITCPTYCSTPNVRCAYPSGTATCNNYCNNVTGQCSTCIPSCGTPTCTSCGTTTINCPAAYCSGNQRCTYPATSSCSNTCSGTDVSGTCGNCIATCTATCSACPSGQVCSAGACVLSPVAAPLAALKGGPDGYLYVPNASKIDPTGHTTISYLKIEEWCNMSDTDCQTIGSPPRQICGCNRTWCDQAGGISPYPTIRFWPDGKIRVDDNLLISTAFGSNEGDTVPPQSKNWFYMADCVITGSERQVRVDDALRTATGFGADGAYSSNTTNIKVKFNNNPNYFTPNANGYIQIPAGALNFIVYNGTKPVLALATFYNTSTGLAAAKAKQAGIAAPAVQMPIGDTWTMAVVILAIIGLALGYFIIREALSVTATKKRKRR